MPKRVELPHNGQILTTKAIIRENLDYISPWVDRGLLYCIANGPNALYSMGPVPSSGSSVSWFTGTKRYCEGYSVDGYVLLECTERWKPMEYIEMLFVDKRLN